MYAKEYYTPEGRAKKMLVDFKRCARICGGIAQQVDADISERLVDELCESAKHLNLELEAMLSRNKRKLR